MYTVAFSNETRPLSQVAWEDLVSCEHWIERRSIILSTLMVTAVCDKNWSWEKNSAEDSKHLFDFETKFTKIHRGSPNRKKKHSPVVIVRSNLALASQLDAPKLGRIFFYCLNWGTFCLIYKRSDWERTVFWASGLAGELNSGEVNNLYRWRCKFFGLSRKSCQCLQEKLPYISLRLRCFYDKCICLIPRLRYIVPPICPLYLVIKNYPKLRLFFKGHKKYPQSCAFQGVPCN